MGAPRDDLFEGVSIAGLTDVRRRTSGSAFADLDRDGDQDIVLVSIPQGNAGRPVLEMFLNQGDLEFRRCTLELWNSEGTGAAVLHGSQAPLLADLNRDGFLDIFVAAKSQCGGDTGDQFCRSNLFVSDGDWFRFRERSELAGVTNPGAHNAYVSVGDVDGNGFLDLAIGGHQIGTSTPRPISRLFLGGRRGFRDVAGRIRGFGGGRGHVRRSAGSQWLRGPVARLRW